MKPLFKIFTALLLFVSTGALAQLPNNIGFEKGTFEGWECSIGQRNNLTNVDVMDPPSSPIYGRHIIIDTTYKNQLDKYGHFPMLCPNGSNYSVVLGDDAPSGQMQRITRTFKVPLNVSTYSIVFNYAVVLEEGAGNNHNTITQPLFLARVYDVTASAYVNCPSFDFAAGSGLPGFVKSDVVRVNSPVYYKDWATAMIDLKSYAGKEVRIEFTTEDCRPSGHFGYAYLDIDEELSLKPINGNVFCSNQSTTTLNGPTGYQDYIWFKDGDMTQPGVHGQSYTVQAIDKKKYTLQLIPYPDLGCPDFLNIELEELAEPFNLVVAPMVHGCPGIGANLKASIVTAGSSSNMKFAYYKDAGGIEYLPNPNAVLTPGIYYIRGTNAGGCTAILPVEVVIDDLTINVNSNLSAQYPNYVDLANAFTHVGGITYTYFSDAAATQQLADSKINVTGKYYIKATNITNCSILAPVNVIITPPPPYTINSPNTFTPNGDGINDKFFFNITGYASLNMLQIFNRYGQLVFTTRSVSDQWNGDMNGKNLPTGTYYWIFNGTDDYYHTKFTKSSSITIIR